MGNIQLHLLDPNKQAKSPKFFATILAITLSLILSCASNSCFALLFDLPTDTPSNSSISNTTVAIAAAAAGASIIGAILAGLASNNKNSSNNNNSSSNNNNNNSAAATLASIAITPSLSSIASSTTQQFTATGTYSDGTIQDLTNKVVWSSNDSGVTINSVGLAVAIKTSSPIIAKITATLDNITSPKITLTVTAATLISLAITPSSSSIASGTTQQFTATGVYSDGTTQDLTTMVTWSSNDFSKVIINSEGLATALNIGNASIQAALSGMSAIAALTVIPLYTIIYYDNGASSGSAPTDNTLYEPETQVTVQGSNDITGLKKSGAVLTKWNNKADGSGDNYAPGATFNITSNTTLYAIWETPTVGMAYPNGGGTIVSVNADLKKILIMANEDQSTGMMWATKSSGNVVDNTPTSAFNGSISKQNGCGKAPDPCSYDTIGSGSDNTQKILAALSSTDTSAAKTCSDYRNPNDGTIRYTDWYLPSIWELNTMYTYAKNGTTNSCSGNSTTVRGGFSCVNYYWSSTECAASDLSDAAFVRSFNGDADATYHKNASNIRVRAVRAIGY